MTDTDARTGPVAVGLIGAGWIGAFHGETLARRLPAARLVNVADPAPGAAEQLAGLLGAPQGHHGPGRVAGRPGRGGGGDRRPARSRAALAIALAAIGSVDTGGPVRLSAVEQR